MTDKLLMVLATVTLVCAAATVIAYRLWRNEMDAYMKALKVLEGD